MQIEATQDWERIMSLPRRHFDPVQAERDVEDLTPLLTTPLGKKEGARLRAIQAWVLREFYEYGGTYAQIKVGGGKTLIFFLAAYVCEAKRPVLFVPEALFEKTHKEFAEYAQHWVTPRPPPRLVGYKEITREENVDLLFRLEPDFIGLDEVDILANQEGSGAKRVDRYIEETGVPCLAATGTSGRMSIMNYSHFLIWTLKGNAPIPLDHAECENWANALDEKPPQGYGAKRIDPGVLLELAELPDTQGMSMLGQARATYQERLITVPGCTFVDDDDCDQPLTIRHILAPDDPIIEGHYEHFLVRKKTPDDWDVIDPLSKWKFDGQLGCGMHLVWNPRPPKEWLEVRKTYARFVRAAIERSAYSRRPLDTELAVKKAFPTHPAIEAWREMEPTFDVNVEVRWHSGSVLGACADWLKIHSPALIWVPHLEFGYALSELTNLQFYAAKGLSQAGVSIERADPSKSAILSIGANLRGRNLQAWNKNLVVGMPPSAKYGEQLIGRTHRSNQKRPVSVDIMLTSGGTDYAFDMMLREAMFVLSSQGQKQKLLRAKIKRAVLPLDSFRWSRKEEF